MILWERPVAEPEALRFQRSDAAATGGGAWKTIAAFPISDLMRFGAADVAAAQLLFVVGGDGDTHLRATVSPAADNQPHITASTHRKYTLTHHGYTGSCRSARPPSWMGQSAPSASICCFCLISSSFVCCKQQKCYLNNKYYMQVSMKYTKF